MTDRAEGSTDGTSQPTPVRPWTRSWLPYLLLAVILAVHVAFVVKDVRDRHALDHDEIISQLVATGHLDDWHRLAPRHAPMGAWATGAELRAFTEVDASSSPAEARRDLADLDIHPPLYFWGLLGTREVGFGNLWSGAALNLALMVLAGAILYALLAELLEDRLLAALAVGAFAFSPGLVRGAAYARQYPLLMLLGIALIWVTTRLLRSPRSPWFLGAFFAVAMLGLLTAHQFAFAIVGAVLVVSIRWWRTNRRGIAYTCVAAAGGVLAAFAIHPEFLVQYQRLGDRAEFLESVSTRGRARLWTEGFFDLVTLHHVERALDVALVVVLVALLLTSPRWYRAALRVVARQPVVGAAVGVGGVTLLGATVAYVFGRSPPHAAGWQYVIFFWPSIVLVGAFVVKRVTAHATVVMVVVVAVLFVSTWRWEQLEGRSYAGQRAAVREVSAATLVVADCLLSGYTPGAAMWVRPHAAFLLAAPDDAAPPRVPSAADRSRAVLLHADDCGSRPGGVDGLVADLGFVRGTRIGPVGRLSAYRLEAASGGAKP